MNGALRILFVTSRDAAIPNCLMDQSIAVTSCTTGVRAIREFERTGPDVVILDAADDFQSKLQFFYSLRSIGETPPTPVVALVQSDQAHLILLALEAGIDRCIDYHLESTEVASQIHELANRWKDGTKTKKVHFADLVLDPVNFKAWRGSRLVPLSILQLRLLKFFMAHPGQVFSRGQLLHGVWRDEIVDEGTVTQCVVRLRRALTTDGEPDLIRSARGVGYALSEPREA